MIIMTILFVAAPVSESSIIVYCTNFEYWFVFLCYSGDTDSILPITSTRYSIDALNLPVIGHWRAWYDNGQVKHSLSRTSYAYNSMSAALFQKVLLVIP